MSTRHGMGAWSIGSGENELVVITRTATPEDAAAVAGIHVRSWQAAYRGLFPDEYLDGLRAEDRMARYTLGETGTGHLTTTVAVDDGTLCGFATTGPARDDDVQGAGEVYALYVDPGAWGRGVGRLLMAEARIDIGRRRECSEAVLWVLAGNRRAQRFYRADGWLPDGARRVETIWGVWADLVRWRSPVEGR
jgi:ribosomal protein S18 acetylase RimI-like enzyme